MTMLKKQTAAMKLAAVNKQVRASRRSMQTGMTLIEVMVAVFVLAIGMLGMAALLTSSKQAGYEAVQRGSAVTLAQDILGRIRSNSTSALSYNGLVVGTNAKSAQACGDTANCSGATLVAFDAYEWEQALMGVAEQTVVDTVATNAGGLVNPTGCVTVTRISPTSSLVTVAIAWRGLQVLSNPVANTCGQGSGRYGTGDAQRQLLVMQSFVEKVPVFN